MSHYIILSRLPSQIDCAAAVTNFVCACDPAYGRVDIDGLDRISQVLLRARPDLDLIRVLDFIPVISGTTQRRPEGYFRREWSYALDRVRNMAEGALFILPVILDDTAAENALAPDRFKALHFTQLPGGQVTPEFAQRLSGLMQVQGR